MKWGLTLNIHKETKTIIDTVIPEAMKLGIIPVSYTHLDVYKRQLTVRSKLFPKL